MVKLAGGWVSIAAGVGLMAWSLAIGFFDFELLRYVGGLVGLLAFITGIDMVRDTPHPWWTGGKSSYLR